MSKTTATTNQTNSFAARILSNEWFKMASVFIGLTLSVWVVVLNIAEPHADKWLTEELAERNAMFSGPTAEVWLIGQLNRRGLATKSEAQRIQEQVNKNAETAREVDRRTHRMDARQQLILENLREQTRILQQLQRR